MLINIHRALAAIIPICNIPRNLLSKITPRYFMWFTKGTCRPFSVRGVAWSASMGEADGMSLKIIIGLLCTSTHTTIPFW
jgi:hypothetical protein